MDSTVRHVRRCRMLVLHPITGLNLLIEGTDLLDGDTDTSTVSQRSESGQRILCDKEDIGKYDMWYGVVCQSVMSSCMSVTTGFATTKRVLFPVLSVTSPYLVYYESIKRELIKVCVYFQLD